MIKQNFEVISAKYVVGIYTNGNHAQNGPLNHSSW